MDYRERYEKLKTDLLAANAEIEYDDQGMRLSNEERTYFRNKEDFDVPDDLFAFYKNYDGLSLRWSSKSDNIGGFILIHQFLDMQENQTKSRLFADFYKADDITEIQKHRILEMIHGNDAYVTILFEPKSNNYQLYYVAEGCVDHGGSKDLPIIPLTITEYLDIVFGYCGVYSVRHHLHKPGFYDNPRAFIPEWNWLEKSIPDFNPPQFKPTFK